MHFAFPHVSFGRGARSVSRKRLFVAFGAEMPGSSRALPLCCMIGPHVLPVRHHPFDTNKRDNSGKLQPTFSALV